MPSADSSTGTSILLDSSWENYFTFSRSISGLSFLDSDLIVVTRDISGNSFDSDDAAFSFGTREISGVLDDWDKGSDPPVAIQPGYRKQFWWDG